MKVSGELLCLFSSRVERRNGSYVIEIPESEIEEGTLSVDEVYSVGVLSQGSSAQGTERERASEPQQPQPQPPVEEGEVRYVEIEDIGKQGDGIARVERGYVIIVPGTDVGDRVKVEIDEVKDNFAVGEVIEEEAFD
ncbi:MAG: TRAM domain-containing protein [Halobacteria archaeon]|nr:TRAM domain-containing protein [Halobacteria archaeon]